MAELEIFRTGPLSDAVGFWQYEIPVYLFLGGLTAGIMLISAYFSKQQETSRWIRWSPFLGIVLLSLGMLALLLDLEQKSHFYRFFMAFEIGAPMSWGSWILVLVYPAMLGLGVANLHNDEVSWINSLRVLKAFRLTRLVNWVHKIARDRASLLQKTNFVLGAGLGIYTGILLETVGIARPLWNSLALGPLFLVSGFSTGAAVLMLLPLRHQEHAQLVRMDIVAIWVELGLLLALIGNLASGGGLAAHFALSKILQGPYTALFWVSVVAVGLLVPLIIETLQSRKQLKPSVLVPVLLLCGGFALRWVIVTAGQSVQLVG